MTTKFKTIAAIALVISIVSIGVFYKYGRSIWVPYYIKIRGKQTVAEVVKKHGPVSNATLKEYFDLVGAEYPPKKIKIVAYKKEKKLELWNISDSNNTLIHMYKILAASGMQGPKLKEGDKQVPEGFYKLEYLNPNSSYHLSMKLNYPNDFDKKYAALEGRTRPGTNIFIHGKDVSIGCLAMGDKTIEELFVLTHKIGMKNVEVVIFPYEPLRGKLIPAINSAQWISTLYTKLESEYHKLKG